MEEEFEEGEKGCLRIYEELGFYSFFKKTVPILLKSTLLEIFLVIMATF